MVTTELTLEALTEDAGGASSLETRLLRSSVTRVQLLRLAMRGLHATEASRIVGCHVATARTHYSDPDFRRAVLSKVEGAFAGTDAAFIARTKTLTEKLEEQAAKSFDELTEMLDPNGRFGVANQNLRFRINKDFLDRHAETAPVTRSKVTLDPMQLTIMAQAASEMDDHKVVEMKKIG